MLSTLPSPTSEKPEARQVLLGLLIMLVLLAVVIGAVIGLDYLSNRYYATTSVVIFVLVVAVLAFNLRTCLRLAKGSEYSARLYAVTFWVVMSTFSVIVHFGEMLSTDHRNSTGQTSFLGMCLAMMSALVVIERLLKKVVPEPPAMEGSERPRSPEGGV